MNSHFLEQRIRKRQIANPLGKVLSGSICLTMLLTACATVKTDHEWERVRAITKERTGEEIIWEESPREELEIQHEIEELTADGLSRQEATRIALINNRGLQRTFEEIGISKSDLVQAGLFTNPSLEAIFRFPSGGGRSNVEAAVFFSLSDFWQIPLRKKVAAAQMEATIIQVAEAVLETTAKAKSAYDAVFYLSEIERKTHEVLQKVQETKNQVAKRRDFGFASDQDLYLAEIMVIEAEMEAERLRSDLAIARAHLNRVLGLGPSQADYQILHMDPEPIDFLLLPEDVVAYALRNRLDIRLAQFRISEIESRVELERMRVLKHVGVGASYEREPGGTDLSGPAIDIQIPLFDQNQARISKAQYQLRQAHKNLEALEGQIREEVLSDIERIAFLQIRAQKLRDKIIPLREKAVSYAETWVKSMQLHSLHLLEAQKGLLKSHRDYLQTLMALRHAVVDLELHLGGRLSERD